LLFLFLSAPAWAAKDFSSWRKFSQGALIGETTALAPGSMGTIGLHVKLAKDWHTYWVNPGDSGAPIRLNFKTSEGLTIKRVLMPLPERKIASGLISFAYSDEVLFLIEVDVGPKVPVGSTASFSVDAEWLVCEDVCIPAIDTLKLDLPVGDLSQVQPGEKFALFQRTRTLIPQKSIQKASWRNEKDGVYLTFGTVDGEVVDFFPFKNSGVTNEKPKFASEAPLTLKLNAAAVPRESDDRVGVLVLRKPGSKRLEPVQYGEPKWSFEQEGVSGGRPGGVMQFLWMLVSAFIGGLILNLMPCVFPILSIKLLSILKLGKSHKKEIRSQNFAYVAGVLVSFLAIALLLAGLRAAGSFIGWGFQLQSPVFLTLLCWLFFLLALNLFGVFELDFLNAGFGGKLTRMAGWWGSFFTGVLAVVVASPCTAPFMGVALGFGLTQTIPVLISIFLMLGLGLAFPYLLMAIFPGAVRALPKPGKWMTILKQVMAFPLLLTMVWLLWILAQVRGPNAVGAVLGGCVALAFIFWLPGKKAKRFAKAAAAIVLVLGLIFIYRGEEAAKAQVGSEVWQPYSEALMEKLKGKAVFIDMTADWCLTCKVNEKLVLNDPEIMALFEAKKIILVKGDWTQRNEEITRFLTRYDRVGVPFYVLYSPQHPQGLPLPEVLTKSSFKDLILKEFP
jgi:thiol:disulfide interchange protein/DsbC/DsbD-like thiol-disulfide interchange protein